MNGILRVNSAGSDLVSLTEAKAQTRVTSSNEDTLLGDYVSAASSMIDGPEGMAGRAFAAQTWDYILPRLPDSFLIPVPGATSVSAASYYDTDDVNQSLTVATYYRVIERDDGLLLELKDGVQLPEAYQRTDAATFTVSAGGTIPEHIKHAALVTVATWFDHREMGEVPMAAQQLINRDRAGWVGA